ncbi:uncharacterized protein [Amphiura filiformis]|uniref:uncharacterized protein n=1 Tax=Amphiura filiformis TaxID=82378 RepID=UPI003B2133C7
MDQTDALTLKVDLEMTNLQTQPAANADPREPSDQSSANETGSLYIRWGSRQCPDTAEVVYTGYVGGSHFYNDGGGSNYLCLPQDPDLIMASPGIQSTRARIDTVEYYTDDFDPLSSRHHQDAACAVCQTKNRSMMLMIPAKLTCPIGWIREYFGYIMSSMFTSKRSEFICVDKSLASAAEREEEYDGGGAIYLVEARCLDPRPENNYGALPCDQYPDGTELVCVVCTK